MIIPGYEERMPSHAVAMADLLSVTQAKYGLALDVGLDGPERFDATLHGSNEEHTTLELTLSVELGVDREGGAIRCADAHGEDSCCRWGIPSRCR
jgi:hypothetical protein